MRQGILRRGLAAGLAVCLCAGTAGAAPAAMGEGAHSGTSGTVHWAVSTVRMGDSGVPGENPGKVLDSGKLRMARVVRMPVSTHDIGTASVTLKDDAVACSEEKPHKITGTATGGNTVKVEGGTHYLLIENLTIEHTNGSIDASGNAAADVAGDCAFDIQGSSVVYLELVGTNELRSGALRAGLHLPKGAALTISAADGSGALKVIGGANSAGIGGNGGIGESCGTLTIEGKATVEVVNSAETNGNNWGAAIGGGGSGSGYSDGGSAGVSAGDGGTILIQGEANVTAISNAGRWDGRDFTSPAIGGGSGVGYPNAGGGGGTLTLESGTLTADTIACGGGGVKGSGGKGGTVTISGGTLAPRTGGGPLSLAEGGDSNTGGGGGKGGTVTLKRGSYDLEDARLANGGTGNNGGGGGGDVILADGTYNLANARLANGGYGGDGGGGGNVTLTDGRYNMTNARLADGGDGGDMLGGGGHGGKGGKVSLEGGTHTLNGARLANGGGGGGAGQGNGGDGGDGGEVTLAGGAHTLTDGALLANGGGGGGGGENPLTFSGRGGKGGDGGKVTLAGGTHTLTGALLANGGGGGGGNHSHNGGNGGDGGKGSNVIIEGGSHNLKGVTLGKGGAGGDRGDTDDTDGTDGTDGSTVNGADTALVLYPVQIGDTPLADTVFTDLVTDPAYSYDMTDTATDGAGMLYLWLPEVQRTVTLTDEDGNADYKGTPVKERTTVVGRPVGTFALTGLEAPAKGATPDTTLTLDDSVPYTVKTVTWSPNDSSYKPGTVYTATITLEAKAGYTFMAVPENGFTVAGGTATNEAGGKVVTVVYPATGKDGVPDPTGVFTATGPDSGTLTGVAAGWEYSLDGGKSWSTVSGNGVAVTGVTAEHGVWIKSPATGSTLESEIQKIPVIKGAAVSGVTVQSCTTAANNDGALLGLQSTMEVRPEDGGWTSATGDLTGLVPGVYQVRTKAVGTRLSGESSSFTVGAYGVPAPKGTAQDSTIAYRLRSGANQRWQDGDRGLTFAVDTQNGKFMGVGVGGMLLDASHYTYEGSTLTLRPAYLATLGEGVYNLRIRYSDGAAETAFTVVAGGRVGSGSGSGSPGSGGGNVPTPGIPGSKPNPSTGR